MKKSFILHYDSLSVIDKMTDEQAGKLFKLIKSYHYNKEYICNDNVVELVFEQFKNQFDRDLDKYNEICKRNIKNGKKGGRPKIQNNPKNPSGLSKNPKNPSGLSEDKKGNEDINNLIEKVKEEIQKNGFVYKRGKYERSRAQNILSGKDYGEFAQNIGQTREQFAVNIIKASFMDKFWRGKIFNCDTIYRFYPQVYNNFISNKIKENISSTSGDLSARDI